MIFIFYTKIKGAVFFNNVPILGYELIYNILLLQIFFRKCLGCVKNISLGFVDRMICD